MILVSGASGYLGKHLVNYLSAQGSKVRALYHNHPPLTLITSQKNIEWKKCDLLDIYDIEEAMENITHVYHCAAIVSFQPEDRGRMLHFNTESTINIVNQCILQRVKKLVHVSSIAAIGRTNDETKEINEDVNWEETEYNSAYGLSKYLSEREIWRGIGEGLDAVIVNPGIIIGGTNLTGLSLQLTKTVNKEFPFYSSGINSWVDVEDVVKIMFLLMNSNISAERYILSAGNFSYREIFTKLALALSKKPPHIPAGAFISGLAWRSNSIFAKISGNEPVLTEETVKNAMSKYYYSNQKIIAALLDFKFTNIDNTIQNMATAFSSSNIAFS